MLNIHSFLQKAKEQIIQATGDSFRSVFMLVAYTLASIVLVFCTDGFYNNNNNVLEVYAKSEDVVVPFEKNNEETAEANIQTDTIILKTIGEVTANAVDKLKENKIKQEQEVKRLEKIKKAEKKAIKEKKLRKEKKAKQKALKEKKAKEAAKYKINLSSSEKDILLRIVEAEATGEDVKGRVLVGNVIMNRVRSKQFPNTVKEVVFQRNGSTVQFSPTKDGRYWSVSISEKTRDAVDQVLKGVDYSQGALYFSARSRADKSNMRWFDRNLKWLFKYRSHEFYTNK